MATTEQRLKKLEAQACKIAGDGKGRVECDEEGRVLRAFFKTRTGGERPATADELKSIQVRWDAMTEFLTEHGIGAVELLYDDKLKAECMKAMEDALHNWRQSK